MAKRVTEHLVDDIDGSEAAVTIRFAVDGTEYEIDLSEDNASEFHDTFARYISAARRVGGRARSSGRSASRSTDSGKVDPKEVRAWAESNGIEVSKRGRIPSSLIVRFQEAQ